MGSAARGANKSLAQTIACGAALAMRRRAVLARFRGMALWLLLGFALSGCNVFRSPVAPVPTIIDLLPGNSPVGDRILLVFLPGAQEVPEDLVREGFVQQVRKRGIAADVVLADMHPRYYSGRTFDKRLKEDILDPARARGYRQVWLAGISLGGFGSLMYSRLNEGAIDGVIAMAPFIATNSVLEEVNQAGGLAQWNEPVVEGDWQRDLLRWLKGYGDPTAKRPLLFIGYGTRDGFASFNAAVGALLPAQQVRSAEGGHDWGPWKQLWGEFLDLAPLPRVAK